MRLGFFIKFLLIAFLLNSCKSSKVGVKATKEELAFELDSFINPILPGFNPDPSICRVGEDYYLVTSTFEYFPGVPIYHSKDLVNWKLISHVLNRSEQLNLVGVASTAGIYAPTIRHHNGVFYMITTLVANKNSSLPKGNFIVTSRNIKGPWSNPIWLNDADGIDPSLFFDDDGKVYYSGNQPMPQSTNGQQKQIWIQEIDPVTFKFKGDKGILDSKIYFEDSTLIGKPTFFEAPHIYKKDGVYYLLISHGGTGVTHASSIWKSKSPLGPWEANPANPIMTNRDNKIAGINCTGHGDLFQTQNGEWWMTFLAVRAKKSNLNLMGRETFLAPVDWPGEWPIVNPGANKGLIEFKYKKPNLPKQPFIQKYEFRDDFDQSKLDLNWTMIRNPLQVWVDLKAKKGFLQMSLLKEQIVQNGHPAVLGIRVPDMRLDGITKLDFTPAKDNECAGLALFRGHDAEWIIVKEKVDTNYFVSVYYNSEKMTSTQIIDKLAPTYLKIEINGFEADFLYSENGTDFSHVAAADISAIGFPTAGRFTGSFIGLYASSRDKLTTNKAYFDFFELKRK
jgi:xylan 1,4-beta-xylosidase